MSKVTISFPVYNGERYVERSLLSALNQTFEDIEYQIIDDCGRAEAMDIVRRVVAEHPRKDKVRFIKHPKNLGISLVRNNSIDNASSPYLYMMDSDDILATDCIERMYEEMERTKVDFVAGSVNKVYEDGTCDPIVLEDVALCSNEQIVKYHIKHQIYMMTWNKLYNVEFLRSNNIRCAPYQKGEDDVFWFQVIWHAKSCRLLSNMTYDWIWNSSSVTGVMRRAGLDAGTSYLYQDIVLCKKKYLSSNSHPLIMTIFEKMVVVDALWRAMKVAGSKVLTSGDRRKYVDEITDFSMISPELKRGSSWRIRVFLRIFDLPYTIKCPLLRLIRMIKKVK